MPHDETKPGRFPLVPCLIIALCALILRIGTNLSRVDENYAEGIYRGTLAKALANGMPLWPRHLAEIPHVPGSILVGVLAWPFYLLCGESTFSLRMAGTIFHLAALVTWMLLLHKRLGRRVAILGGLLFAFVPPGFAKMAVLSYGDHVESLPFIFFAACHVIDWTSARERAPWRVAFLAGLGTTLATSFHLQATLGIAALGAVSALIVLPRLLTLQFWKEAALGFAPGAILGAVPAVLVSKYYNSSALTLWGHSPTSHLGGEDRSVGDMIGKFTELWVDGFSYAFQWPHRWIGDIELVAAYACAGFLFYQFLRAWRAGESNLRSALASAGFFAAYPLVFSVVFGLSSSNFKVEEGTSNALEVRYSLPVQPLLILPIACAAAWLIERGRRAAGYALFAPALALGVWGSLSTWDLDIIKNEPARRGYLLEEFDGHLLYASLAPATRENFNKNDLEAGGDPAAVQRLESFLSQRSEPARMLEVIRQYDALPEWTWPLRYIPPRLPIGAPPGGDPVKLLQWLRAAPAEYKLYACVAAGEALGSAATFAPTTSSMILAAGASPEENRALARGFGRGLLEVVAEGSPRRPRFFDGRKAAERLNALPPALDRAEAAFALGFRIGNVVNEFYQPGDWLLIRAIANFPRELLPALARGAGAGYRLRFLTPPAADTPSPGARRIVSIMPPGLAVHFREGLGGASTAK